MEREKYEERNSIYIVTKLVEESIIEKALKSYIPTKAVYYSCWENAKDIKNSIVAVSQPMPDCQPPQIGLIEESIRNPTTFKVKHRSMLEQSLGKPMSRHNSRPSALSIQNLNSINQNLENCKQAMMSPTSNFQTRFYPNASLHASNNAKILDGSHLNFKTKQIGRKNQAQDDVIKTLRQIKLHDKTYSHKRAYKHKNKESLKKQKGDAFIHKLKQAQMKKRFLTSISNYEGKSVHILKKQIPKIVPHFIDVGVEIVQENIKSEAFHPCQQTIKNMPDDKRQSLRSDILKEISNEQNSQFVKTLLENFSTSSNCKIVDELQIQREEQTQTQSNCSEQIQKSKQFQEFKFTGNYEPVRVGFKTFQSLKKANWKTQKAQTLNKNKKQSQSQSEWKMADQQLKNKKKESKIESESDMIDKQSIHKSSRHKQKIQIGSHYALEYLFNEKKTIKKKVTINSQFI